MNLRIWFWQTLRSTCKSGHKIFFPRFISIKNLFFFSKNHFNEKFPCQVLRTRFMHWAANKNLTLMKSTFLIQKWQIEMPIVLVSFMNGWNIHKSLSPIFPPTCRVGWNTAEFDKKWSSQLLRSKWKNTPFAILNEEIRVSDLSTSSGNYFWLLHSTNQYPPLQASYNFRVLCYNCSLYVHQEGCDSKVLSWTASNTFQDHIENNAVKIQENKMHSDYYKQKFNNFLYEKNSFLFLIKKALHICYIFKTKSYSTPSCFSWIFITLLHNYTFNILILILMLFFMHFSQGEMRSKFNIMS